MVGGAAIATQIVVHKVNTRTVAQNEICFILQWMPPLQIKGTSLKYTIISLLAFNSPQFQNFSSATVTLNNFVCVP